MMNLNMEILTRAEVEGALARAPAIRPLLMRLARRAAQGKPLPQSFSSKGLDAAAQHELEKLFHTVTGRDSSGSVYGSLLFFLQDPANWREACEVLGVAKSEPEESLDDMLLKLAWRFPEWAGLLQSVQETPEIMRFLAKKPNREQWKQLFISFVPWQEAGLHEPTTLSQLGADWLHDSKILRTGALRRQLVLLLARADDYDLDAVPEEEVLKAAGIVVNPCTTFVSVYAPFILTLDDGSTLNFPQRLFEKGLSCTLPLETVQRIKSVEWKGTDLTLTTSENAAPFARLVAARRACVYTEGYPNSAVTGLLDLFRAAGVKAIHAGDADLDGFRIALFVGVHIPLTRLVAAEIVQNPGTCEPLPMPDTQAARMRRQIDDVPNNPTNPYLEKLLARGCWYEQENFPL